MRSSHLLCPCLWILTWLNTTFTHPTIQTFSHNVLLDDGHLQINQVDDFTSLLEVKTYKCHWVIIHLSSTWCVSIEEDVWVDTAEWKHMWFYICTTRHASLTFWTLNGEVIPSFCMSVSKLHLSMLNSMSLFACDWNCLKVGFVAGKWMKLKSTYGIDWLKHLQTCMHWSVSEHYREKGAEGFACGTCPM